MLSTCPPAVDVQFTTELAKGGITYSYDTIATVISLFRFYLIFPVLEHLSFWTSVRAKRVANLNGVKADSFFAIRAYLVDKPITCLTIGLALSVSLLGFAIRLFEANRGYLYNNFYLIMVTMATIGYGDMYPVTYFGRIVAIVACIFGVFLISLFTVTLIKATEFRDNEDTVYDEITRRRKLSKHAAGLIKLFLYLNLLRKAGDNHQRRSEILMKLIARASRFKIQRHSVQRSEENIDSNLKDLDKSTDVIDELQQWVSEVAENHTDLKRKIKNSLKYSELIVKIAADITEFGNVREIKEVSPSKRKSNFKKSSSALYY